MKKNNSKKWIKTITITTAVLVFAAGAVFALKSAGTANTDKDSADTVVAAANEATDLVVKETVSEKETEVITETAATEATTEEQHAGVYNDLTGEWVTDRTEEYGRPIAVMLNNISDAMPQCDIGKADIVYEMKVEGGITRLLGIFNDYSNLEKLGSVCSCRP